MMPKSDVIAAILNLSPATSPMFLAEFPITELRAYCSRLRSVAEPQGTDEHAPVDAREATAFVPRRRP